MRKIYTFLKNATRPYCLGGAIGRRVGVKIWYSVSLHFWRSHTKKGSKKGFWTFIKKEEAWDFAIFMANSFSFSEFPSTVLCLKFLMQWNSLKAAYFTTVKKIPLLCCLLLPKLGTAVRTLICLHISPSKLIVFRRPFFGTERRRGAIPIPPPRCDESVFIRFWINFFFFSPFCGRLIIPSPNTDQGDDCWLPGEMWRLPFWIFVFLHLFGKNYVITIMIVILWTIAAEQTGIMANRDAHASLSRTN